MNMEYLMQELCKKVTRMNRESFNNMIKRLEKAYKKSHKLVEEHDWSWYEEN